MASFTDQLVAFNPYVSQIPVDDYVRVGMQKQQDYNQGVEKVQGYIDSVAGLEVIKPEQKDYLNQRINNLQQETGRIVQADFSNQQLVNSVGALTSKIASDPIIQTSVASTQTYKQGIAAMKDAQQKGKSSASREWEFQDQFQKWYSDGDVTTRFNGQFKQATDVVGKVSKIIKDLDPNSQIEDNPFKRGAKGEILMDKDGLPQIDWAMIEKGTKTLTPERIKAALSANMTPDDLDQLRVDGRYSYRALDAAGMKDITDQTYQYKLDQVNDIIQGLTIQRAAVNNDPQQAAQIDAQIQAYKDKASYYQNSYGQDMAMINNNLEGYKGQMYTQNWLNKFGDGYAYAQNSLTYKENPYFMAAERRRENDIKWNEFLADQRWKAADSAYKAESLRIGWYNAETSRMNAGTRAAGKKTAQGALEGIPLSDAVLEPIQQEDLDQVNLNNFVKETDQISADIDQQKMALLGNTGLVTIKRDPDGTNPRYEFNVAGKDPNTVINAANAAVDQLKAAYDKDPSSVDDGTRTYFKNLANADQVIQNRKFSLGKIKTDAEKEHDLTPYLNKFKDINLTTTGGQKLTITPAEVMEFNRKLEQVYPVKVPSTGMGYGSTYQSQELNDEKAAKIMNNKEKVLYNVFRKKYNGGELNNTERTIATTIDGVNSQVNNRAAAVIEGRDTYVNNAVKSVVGAQQPVSFTLEAFKNEDRNRAKAVASNIVASMSREGKGSPGEYFDRGDASKMLSKENDDNTNYSLFSKGRGQYALRMTNENISKKGIDIPLTKPQAEELFGQGQFLDDFYNIRESMQLSKSSGKWTTDVRGLGRESAFNLENGLTNKYSVKYHVEDPLKNGGLQVRMYIYDKAKKQWLPDMTANFGQMLNEAQVTKFLSTVGDQYIDATLLPKQQ